MRAAEIEARTVELTGLSPLPGRRLVTDMHPVLARWAYGRNLYLSAVARSFKHRELGAELSFAAGLCETLEKPRGFRRKPRCREP